MSVVLVLQSDRFGLFCFYISLTVGLKARKVVESMVDGIMIRNLQW